jgi:hypothetical protein
MEPIGQSEHDFLRRRTARTPSLASFLQDPYLPNDAVGSVMLPKLRTIDLPVEYGFGLELTQMLAAIETVQTKGREAHGSNRS